MARAQLFHRGQPVVEHVVQGRPAAAQEQELGAVAPGPALHGRRCRAHGLDPPRLGAGREQGPGLVQLGVDLNVHRSARALLEESEVLRRAALEGRLTIVRAVYRLGTGEVVPLD